MENDEDLDLIALFICTANDYINLINTDNEQQERRFWVNPYLWRRRDVGRYYVDVSSDLLVN